MYNKDAVSPLKKMMTGDETYICADGTNIKLAEVPIYSLLQIDGWSGMGDKCLKLLKNKCQSKTEKREDCTLMHVAPETFFAFSETQNITDRVENLIDENIGVVTDLSHSRTVFSIQGRAAHSLLQMGAAIDLDLDNFPSGSTHQTMANHIGVTILRRSDDEFLCFVFRGFAQSFYEWLIRCVKDQSLRIA